MKNAWTFITLVVMIPGLWEPGTTDRTTAPNLPVTENVFVITTDGFRWQELFNGADSSILFSETFTPDTGTIASLYWDSSPDERRKKLMPFFWNVLAKKGQVFGNRKYHNKVDVANPYYISYPGYHEIFTGTIDPEISSNRKITTTHINVLEYLAAQQRFEGKVAAFTSWDVFPYILNRTNGAFLLNSGYSNSSSETAGNPLLVDAIQNKIVLDKTATRHDELTFLAATEYITKFHPRIMFLGLGETDEFAHAGRYDLYLNHANQVDKMIARLWHMVQTTPGYKDHTTFIITTDHGRGSKTGKWTSHGAFISGSSQTWLAVIGPGIKPAGEIKEEGQFFQQQMARTIAGIVGMEFNRESAAPPLPLR